MCVELLSSCSSRHLRPRIHRLITFRGFVFQVVMNPTTGKCVIFIFPSHRIFPRNWCGFNAKLIVIIVRHGIPLLVYFLSRDSDLNIRHYVPHILFVLWFGTTSGSTIPKRLRRNIRSTTFWSWTYYPCVCFTTNMRTRSNVSRSIRGDWKFQGQSLSSFSEPSLLSLHPWNTVIGSKD
jgi:hypothetical protein